MQLCQLIKMVLSCCPEFLFEDHYFPCSKSQYFGLRFQVKEKKGEQKLKVVQISLGSTSISIFNVDSEKVWG